MLILLNYILSLHAGRLLFLHSVTLEWFLNVSDPCILPTINYWYLLDCLCELHNCLSLSFYHFYFFFFVSVSFGSLCNWLLLSFLINIKYFLYLCIILQWCCRLYGWMSRQNQKLWTDHRRLLHLFSHNFLLHHRMTLRQTCMSATAQKTGTLPCQLYVIVT